MTALTVASTQVRQDADGRYCLNDLHRAAGGHKKNRPGHFLARPETQELIAEIEAETAGRSAVSTTEGRRGGTFVCEDLVFAYAMWISAKFCLRVIRAYKQLTGRELTENLGLMRQRLALESRDATSKVRASFGSHLMLDRKRDLPVINDERARLEEQMQTRLFAFEQGRLAA